MTVGQSNELSNEDFEKLISFKKRYSQHERDILNSEWNIFFGDNFNCFPFGTSMSNRFQYNLDYYLDVRFQSLTPKYFGFYSKSFLEKLKIITFDEWFHWINTRHVLFEKFKP
jgi:hypothetical protein